ncbi:hypothetical protein D3C76_1603310 [compost metagenome]
MKLKLNQETRRIDYLLLELYGLYIDNKGTELGNRFLEMFNMLKQKRHLMTLKREVAATG